MPIEIEMIRNKLRYNGCAALGERSQYALTVQANDQAKGAESERDERKTIVDRISEINKTSRFNNEIKKTKKKSIDLIFVIRKLVGTH